jgi:hypothetical protein
MLSSICLFSADAVEPSVDSDYLDLLSQVVEDDSYHHDEQQERERQEVEEFEETQNRQRQKQQKQPSTASKTTKLNPKSKLGNPMAGGGRGGNNKSTKPSPSQGSNNSNPKLKLEKEVERARKAQEAKARKSATDAAPAFEEALANEAKLLRRQEREKAWTSELAAMNKASRKAATKRRKIDKREVDKVLKANERKDLYAVLGIGKGGSASTGIKDFVWKKLKYMLRGTRGVSSKDVKASYRLIAKRIHPDKNKDSRAEEAFDAVQDAYEILADPIKKRAFDREVLAEARNRREGAIENAQESTRFVWRRVSDVVRICKRIIKPFSSAFLVFVGLLI